MLIALIKAGADVNAKDSQGRTPLIWAASETHNPDVIKILLDFGADPKVKDRSGRMAIDRVPAISSKIGERLRHADAFWELQKASR